MEDKHYAGFWLRFGASLVDSILLIMVLIVLLTLLYGTDFLYQDPLDMEFWPQFLQNILPAILTIYLWHRFGATPGKMLLRLKVVDAKTGDIPSVGQSVGRYFAYIVSTLPFFLGFIWIVFDKRKQGWHDKLAGTVVIQQNISTSNNGHGHEEPKPDSPAGIERG
ncbi:MAG: RDD family protein [Pseudomonadales bacterium]